MPTWSLGSAVILPLSLKTYLYHIIWATPLPTLYLLEQGCLYLFPFTLGPTVAGPDSAPTVA